MKKVLKYLRPYAVHVLFTITLIFIQVMADLKLPDYMSTIVNDGIVKMDTDIIKSIGLKMILVTIISALCTVIIGYFAARISASIARNMRNDVFKTVESFSLNEFDKFSTASLITRSTNDIQQVQMFIMIMLRMVISAPVMAIGGIIKAVETSKSMSWILAVSIPLTIIFVAVIIVILMPTFKKVQNFIDRMNLVSRESLTGIRVIRAFRTEKYEEMKFEKANTDLKDANLFLNRVMAIMWPGMMFLLNITQLAIIWFGAKAIDLGNIQPGDIMAYIQYSMQVLMSFLMLSMVSIILPRASVSAKRISEVLDTQTSIKESSSPSFVDEDATIEFKNVSFFYPMAEEAVLENISFTAKPGQTTAIIGSTGCGKSTLINLIPRFYDVTEGSITIGGKDIRDISLKNLHDSIGYVPQKAVLFSGTIESNIKFGSKQATDEEMELAAQIAQAEEFISQKEEGYNSEIAQGGTNVSGGQKQRLSIARALIKKPMIYIFDDSFSALDYKTDKVLRNALKPYTQNSTVLIVAQRISTILDADQIIVLDEGNIVGKGTHRELLQNCEVYKEIALSQLSKEELE